MTTPEHAHGIRYLSVGLLGSLIGGRITEVGYKLSGQPTGLQEFREEGDAHEVDHAVVISTDSAVAVIEWVIRNYDEFLNVTTPEHSSSDTVAGTVDVSLTPQWSSIVGSRIVGFGVATQQMDDSYELLWSLRMETDSGAAAVFALGDLRGDTPTYQPDNLLVMFRPELAKSFEVLGSMSTAWGTRLLP